MKLLKEKGSLVTGTAMMLGLFSLVALISIPNTVGIRQRSQVSADIRTAEQIGKAVRIWATDVDRQGERVLPDTVTLYSDIDELCDMYISGGYTAKSLPGNYYVYSIQDGEFERNKKILVGISPDVTGLDTTKTTRADITYDGSSAGWAYIEY